MANTPPLAEALRRAELSKDQAHEIAKTESVAPGSTGPLLEIARNSRFHVLKDEARKLRIETQAGPGLAELQHASRFFHHRVTDKGTVRFEGELEPHIGMPIASRSRARHAGSPGRRETPSHSIDTWPTPCPNCCPEQARALARQRWSSSCPTRSPSGDGHTSRTASSARSLAWDQSIRRWLGESPAMHSSLACSSTGATSAR